MDNRHRRFSQHLMLERARPGVADKPLDWLAAILLSWLVPLGLAGYLWELNYRVSLWLWGVPILVLLPRFVLRTRRGDPRRRAMLITSGYIVVAGSFLDFVLGARILKFDDGGDYLLRLPGLGRNAWIPIEEIVFYVLGGIAIVLAYFWADEFWLEKYRAQASIPTQRRIFVVSPPTIAVALGLLTVGLVARWMCHDEPFALPEYYVFLIIAAFVPASALYRSIGELVNWRAFSWTALWVLLTSVIWEVTLALPRQWWGYRHETMIGEYIDAWQLGSWRYPIEALLVWFVVTFSCVLTYEAVKAYQSDVRPARARLFGTRAPAGDVGTVGRS